MLKSGFLRLAAATFLIASLTQISSAETLRWTRAADALTLDPHAQNDGVTHAILNQIYESLVWRDAEGKLIPRLATEWHLKESDPTTWVFKLREGAKFHNGDDLTAEDVVFTLDRARSDKSNLRQLHADVEKVTAVGHHTVEVKLRAPNAIYPNNLTGTYILDKTWAEQNDAADVQDIAAGKDNYAVRNTNGTGPYILKSREVGVRTVLEANEHHWAEKKPEITEIIYTPIADNATRVAALLSGEVDFLHEVPVQDIERLRNTPGIKVSVGPENRSIFLGYRVDSAPLASSDVKDKNPLSDVRVREAFELAIDRDAIKTVVLRGNSVPTGIIVPPFVHGWTEELDAYSKPDVEKAKALLVEAGYPQGFTITLDTPNNRYVNDEAIAQAVVGFLGRIGVKVALASRPYAQHAPLLIDQKSDFYLFGWGVPTFDSAYNFNDLVHTRAGRYGAYNATGYSNPEVDKKIESLGTEIDPAKRDATIDELWKQVKAEHLYLPLHNQVGAWAVRDKFNLEHQPDNSPKVGQATINN
ncbi:peptide ABC transporter substrate-binding protein [Ochrobactrum sp. MYb29]|uniref:ABC transporter substrate-binding protein n=1 Tax=Brucella pituitosa TaxID=571256 RepID=UPI000C26E5BE|nr:ABC transporter substrate-binding protein [Brucella pituitosa]PJO49751.1 peptide ABC transporter substrate-binding protein [Brucella pituitosa]PRA84327.1 peptide ABC transporter substrate-binding protein [Ochrobactrum sp. MYb29]